MEIEVKVVFVKGVYESAQPTLKRADLFASGIQSLLGYTDDDIVIKDGVITVDDDNSTVGQS